MKRRSLLLVPFLDRALVARSQTLPPSDPADGKWIDEQGRKLSDALREHYRSLLAAGDPPSRGHNDRLEETVEPYIAAGMYYNTAEAILRAAGFDVQRWLSSFPGKPSTTAKIDNYPPWTLHLFSKRSLYVILYPPSAVDWSRVASMESNFTFSYL